MHPTYSVPSSCVNIIQPEQRKGDLVKIEGNGMGFSLIHRNVFIKMAQNFRRYTSNDIGTSAATVFTADSYDTIVGISVANIAASTINVDVYINDGSNDIYLIKGAPIVQGGMLQIIDGGSRFVVQSGDALKVKSDTASSADVWVSAVDAIST